MSWILFSLLNAFFHSLAAVFGKKGSQKLNVYSAAWSQSFFGLFVIVPVVIFFNAFQPVNSTFWVALFFSSILHIIGITFYFRAIKDSPISLVMPILSFIPVFLLITSPLMIGEIPTPLGIAGILLTVIGSYVLNLSKRIDGIFEPLKSIVREKGTREMLFVAFIWSIASNVDKIGVVNSNPLLFTLSIFLTLTIIYTAIMLVLKIRFKPIFKNFWLFAAIGIFIGISHMFQMIAVSMTLVANVNAVKRSSALFGTLWGKLIFKEENIGERVWGTIIMLIGVILIVISP